MLTISHLAVRYGAIAAVKDVSLAVNEGEIVAIIGANGAGKTTTFKAISGLLRPAAGHIQFRGRDITGLAPHQVVRQGIVQVPEGRLIIGEMTVHENLLQGAYSRRDSAGVRRDIDDVLGRFSVLRDRLWQRAGTLSGGERQMLAIGRALMAAPQLLLLDEPSLGLAPIVVDEVFAAIQQLNAQGRTILLVEQNARQALLHAHRAYVMETGCTTMGDDAQRLLNDPRVVEAYLGVRRKVPARSGEASGERA